MMEVREKIEVDRRATGEREVSNTGDIGSSEKVRRKED